MSDFTKFNLTLDPFGEEANKTEEAVNEIVPVTVEETPLTAEEQAAVDSFSQKIDLTDSTMILQYGAGAQKNIADFSAGALESVKTKDMGEIGDMISGLVVELKSFDAEEERKGLLGLFQKGSRKLEVMKAKYGKVEANVDRIAGQLEDHQVVLLKDIAVLDQLYDKNLDYFKQLSMYILAGKKTLERERATTLAEMQQKAQTTGLAEDAQAANDYANQCLRFEKKLHDLELTRMISIQMGPQIRLIQNNDSMLVEKIQSSLNNTIPLWKSQMVLALGLEHSRQALEAQREVTDLTNQLLKKNADALRLGTVETAKESERSIVDMETLQHTNQSLISTLDEVLQIQKDGAQKRRDAEAELGRIEGELKQKLLTINN
ncbi:MAG: toxic anion resistance protein [Ruminococcaceae bacterium]|nr:toxic anion resistance protein [Oscillospiraceae bacterium]